MKQGTYRSIPIAILEKGVLQDYGRVLDMALRWESGQLKWHDPETGRHIDTFDDLKAGLDQERVYSDRERTRTEATEERIHSLEAELRHRKS